MKQRNFYLYARQLCMKGTDYINKKEYNVGSYLKLKYRVYLVHDSIVVEGPKQEIVDEIINFINTEIEILEKEDENQDHEESNS